MAKNLANETIDRIANRLLAPKNAESMPVIMATRFTPHPRTYLLFDAGWQGLKKVTRSGRTAWEVDDNFQLRIELDGTCQIPDTKKNRARLALCSQRITVSLDKDPVTGLPYDPPLVVEYPAEYEPIQETMLEKTMIEQIAQRAVAIMAEKAGQAEEDDLRAAPGPDNRSTAQRGRAALPVLDDEEDDLDSEDGDAVPHAAVPTRAPAARPPAAKKPAKARAKPKAKPRGRPAAPDHLLAPLRDRP